MRSTRAPHRKLLAALYGLSCHLLFLAAIAAAMTAMYKGMHLGLVRLPRNASWALDALLLLQFPLLHSFLLSPSGTRALEKCAPPAYSREMVTTVFVIIASIQLLALYLLWSPIGPVWWEAHGIAKVVLTLLYLGAWVLLGRAMTDAGLAVQTGFLGWSSVYRGEAPVYAGMPRSGLFRFTRQPVYVAFFLTLWTVPTWSADQLVLAAWFSLYCLLGPLLKERRQQRRYRQEFLDYRRSVPYFIPRFQKKRPEAPAQPAR